MNENGERFKCWLLSRTYINSVARFASYTQSMSDERGMSDEDITETSAPQTYSNVIAGIRHVYNFRALCSKVVPFTLSTDSVHQIGPSLQWQWVENERRSFQKSWRLRQPRMCLWWHQFAANGNVLARDSVFLRLIANIHLWLSV